MKLGEGVEWSAHCCTVMAALREIGPVSGARLAEFHGVPNAYLVKQLQRLSQSGVVESVAGRNGGYRLARPPEQITLLDVVLAVEGAEPAFRCNEIRQRGPSAVPAERYLRPCGIASAMWKAETIWRDSLAETTIADLLDDLAGSVDPEQARLAIDWLVGEG